MYSENGVLVDFSEISKLMDAADVFVVGFANFPERLLIDTRSNTHETPLVQVVEPTAGARQRLRWLARRRPTLGTPDAFTFIPWPHSSNFLVETGIWERIRSSVGFENDPAVETQCELAIGLLHDLDMAAQVAVLRGENCVTLWPGEDEED